ncbi:MAG: organomercurial lyase [Thermoleophilia bacterium]|nr:organomercurial lyase [Thermoleophilia bacterium]
MTPPRATLTERITKHVIDRVPVTRVFGGADGIRESADALRDGSGEAGGTLPFLRDIALAVPHVPVLLWSLVRDSRVPIRYRAGLVGAGVLAVSPFDTIPDFIPGIGMLDDIAVVLLAVRWTLHAIDEPVLRSHWKGSDASFAALLRVSGRADDEITVEPT